jgi:hypothetical protein
MSDDKMRAEFEAWADKQCMSLSRISWKDGGISEYAYMLTFDSWRVWQAAYTAGRLSVQKEKEDWSKAVNKAFIDSTRKSVDDWREAQGGESK